MSKRTTATTKDSSVREKMKTGSTRIDIKQRARICEILNKLLADASDLGMQCKHAHWNVAGPHFIALHELFDKLYEAAGEHVDQIAERIGALGGHVMGRLQDVSDTTSLKPFPTDLSDDLSFVKALSDAFGHFANEVRESIDKTGDLGDEVTSDLLNAVVQETDKHLWFLEAHLRAPAARPKK